MNSPNDFGLSLRRKEPDQTLEDRSGVVKD